VLPTVGFSPATIVEFTAAANTQTYGRPALTLNRPMTSLQAAFGSQRTSLSAPQREGHDDVCSESTAAQKLVDTRCSLVNTGDQLTAVSSMP
jgi:hypothetical protein